MLVLELRKGERVLLETSDGPVWVTLCDGGPGDKRRLGFEAPREVKILREAMLTPRDRAVQVHGDGRALTARERLAQIQGLKAGES